jgi:N-acyl-D-amino-acid deacylase
VSSDLVFVGATVVDGTGAAGFRADVSVVDGHIDKVGEVSSTSATTVIDARDLVLSPGFIDLHTHSDFTLARFPRAVSMTAQGVTTQLTGNCGFSPFPVLPERMELLREYAGFLALLDKLPLSGNVACQVGHGSVRMAVMGFSTAEPAPEQLSEMAGHVSDAMAAGAFGISSGLTYAPASAAATTELIAVAAAAAEAGGFYSTHIRSEATTLVEAVAEALEVGRQAGLPVQLSHHKVMGRANWPKVGDTLAMVDAASAEGMDVLLDQYPYTAGSTGLAVVLPRWALVGGVAKMQERLADPVQREKIREQIAAQRPEELKAGLRVFEPDTVVIAEAPEGPLTQYIGRTLTEVAEARGQNPVDAALDLLAEAGGEILTIVHGQSEDNLRRIMSHPLTAIASDGWTLSPEAGGRPHPRSYGTYARVLGRYVREEKVLGLEEAVRKMTSLPAKRLGLTDRGVIAPGAVADLVLFDPKSIADNATFENPHQFCGGVRMVVVNGMVVVDGGKDTGAVAGRVLRRQPGAAA